VTVGGRYRYRLRLGDPGAVNLTLVKAPHLSLVLLLTARSSSSAVGRTARAARESVCPSGRVALAPVLASAQRVLPDVAATPIPPSADVSVDEQVQRLRELPDDAVVENLTRTYGPELPSPWRPAAELPRRWLDSYASATMDAWSTVAPRWRRAQPLLDLEARRVGAAVVRGCTDVLLNTLHPRMHYEDGEFWVPSTHEVTDELAGRRLVLVPTIAGPAGRIGFDLQEVPDVFYIAYPVPGQAVLAERGAAPIDVGGDPLCRMLGRMRAQVLRTAHGPVSMGQLAAAVGCSPRVTSYHCDQLEATGLILRERHGKSVWVSRTSRGHELVDLLSA
jgi:DNA-binding transcriptional ArsR family regulator